MISTAASSRPPARPLGLRAWSWALVRWGTADTTTARAFRAAVTALVPVLSRVRGVHWAPRTTGGWWWTSRWRLEWLLSWNEWASTSWFVRLVPRGGVVVDGGAHIGYYARLAAEAVGPTGYVLAVEPFPENIAVLRRNTAPPVEVIPAALGAVPGHARLHESSGSSNHSLYPGYADAGPTLDVPVTTVDALIRDRRLQRVDLVKLDLEGAEVDALLGMRDTVRRHRPVLLVEHAPRALGPAGRTSQDLLDTLDELGYVAFDVTEDATLRSASVPADWVNLLCVPQGRIPAPPPRRHRADSLRRLLPVPGAAALRRRAEPLGVLRRAVDQVRATALLEGRQPVVLQVGAFDGVTNDPLHAHLALGGWRGLLVEPVPAVAQRLRATYAEHPDLVVEQVAVSDQAGESSFYRLRDDLPGAPAWSTQIGSLSREVVLWHRKAIPDIDERLMQVTVPTVPVAPLLARHGLDRVDVVQIDTEGHDARIVRQLDVATLRPTVIMYEHKHLPGGERRSLQRWLGRRGYATVEGPDDTLAVPRRLLLGLMRG